MSQIWFFSYFICITGSFFNLFERPAIIILFVIQASVIHNMSLLFNMVCFLSNRLVFYILLFKLIKLLLLSFDI